MKYRKLVRWQFVLAGLAAGLMFTPAVHSQEITNATFDDGPNVTAFAQSDLAQPSAEATAPPVAVPSANEVTSVHAALSSSSVASGNSPWAMAGLTLILFVSIAFFSIGASKQQRRRSPSGRSSAYVD